MTPAAIIRQAQADGVTLALSPAGSIKATGNGDAVSRWLPVIRERKAEVLAELRMAELVRHLRLYAERKRFTQADFDEALQAAMESDVDGWIGYIQSQNATVH